MALSNPSKIYNNLFSKYTGSGNDFILIDDRTQSFPINEKEFIKRLCHRQYGIGADGVILLQHSDKADFRFRIFNSDGNEAEMCGNGARCFGKFVQELGLNKPNFSLETMQRILSVSLEQENVVVSMGDVKDISWNIQLQEPSITVHHLDTGVPHAIYFVPDVETIDVASLGKEIRNHPHFQPKGANANFISFDKEQKMHIRTYERGVEAETLACGTGATAAALAASFLYDLPSPTPVHMRSKEILTISFKKEAGRFSNITLCGNAHLIFQGSYSKALQ